ncbi:hypothetical protein [Methylobacterium sp. P1-11]|uniref:hypothetical protein n=1 Tax=Methylobacterium sp. P1-11 TaxID=2024616 RepID=UPI0011EC2F61|nr:hypothetical protein [Methylobacterium sp. P1-11]
MADRIIDPTVPGRAGLYFNLRLLSRNAHIAAIPGERAAREALERWCHFCGQRSCYGFGETLTTAGILTCADASCRSSAEAEIARRLCPSPLAKPSDETAAPTLDLFGRAA